MPRMDNGPNSHVEGACEKEGTDVSKRVRCPLFSQKLPEADAYSAKAHGRSQRGRDRLSAPRGLIATAMHLPLGASAASSGASQH